MSKKNHPGRRKDTEPFLERANEQLQERATDALPSAIAGYGLIGAILLFGLIGYGIDRWRGVGSHTFLVVGILVGVVVGFIDLVKLAPRR